jgi:tRNA pseudouridine13 synthase
VAAASPAVRAAALAPPRAHGLPLEAATLRAVAEDFLVEEELGFAPDGAGQHLLLRVRKRDANTAWVAKRLAQAAGCREFEVGYAGLKDRRAVAVQWFSVPRPRAAAPGPFAGEGFEVLEMHAHARKLPRGALAGNRFAIRMRAADGDGPGLAQRLAPRLALIGQRGVPNYFGPQRFGREGANLAPRPHGLARLKGAQRGLLLSAARSLVFNALLAARVADGSWQRLGAGDVAILDGRGSIFPVDEVDAVLAARCQRLEIHPSGPLWGQGEPPSAGPIRALELAVAAGFPEQCALCAAAGMRPERRSLRLAVAEASCEAEAGAALLRFRLGRGAFATAVLRELLAAASDAD